MEDIYCYIIHSYYIIYHIFVFSSACLVIVSWIIQFYQCILQLWSCIYTRWYISLFCAVWVLENEEIICVLGCFFMGFKCCLVLQILATHMRYIWRIYLKYIPQCPQLSIYIIFFTDLAIYADKELRTFPILGAHLKLNKVWRVC